MMSDEQPFDDRHTPAPPKPLSGETASVTEAAAERLERELRWAYDTGAVAVLDELRAHRTGVRLVLSAGDEVAEHATAHPDSRYLDGAARHARQVRKTLAAHIVSEEIL